MVPKLLKYHIGNQACIHCRCLHRCFVNLSLKNVGYTRNRTSRVVSVSLCHMFAFSKHENIYFQL